MSQHERLSRWLSAGRRRLRIRAAWRGAAIGGIIGSAVAIGVVALARTVFDAPLPVAAGLVGGGPLVGALLGALGGLLQHRVDARGIALVLDQVGGTEERLITALHLAEADSARAAEALALVDEVAIDKLAERLPVRWPQRWRVAPLLVGLALAALALPAADLSGFTASTTRSPLSEAGTRLRDRLAEIDSPPERAWPDDPDAAAELERLSGGEGELSSGEASLPEDLDRQVRDLAEAMEGEALTQEEAAAALEELAQQLEALEDSMADAKRALDALEDAAKELDEPATKALEEALENGDAEAAEQAAQQLQESMSKADPQTRQKAAEAMRQAGEKLSQSGDPKLTGAGEALQQAASQTQRGQLSSEQAQELAQQLQRARQAGEQMARDRAALERAQRLAGAVEGARQQLGEGDPSGQSSQGEGSGEGEGAGGGQGAKEGEAGDGEGEGQVAGASAAGQGAGTDGHTWEDEGEYAGNSSSSSGSDRETRSSDRQEGRHIDDFEKFYESVRLKGAQSLVAGTNSTLDESGRIDELEYRLTTAQEAASVDRVTLPDGYRDAASAAIEAEPIPPAYKNAVRDYFAEMD